MTACFPSTLSPRQVICHHLQGEQLSKLPPPSRLFHNPKCVSFPQCLNPSQAKLKYINNPGVEVQVKRAFKSYSFFVTQKNNTKADRACIKFSSAPNTSMQLVPQSSPISKSTPSLFGCSLFSKEYLNPQVKINKMVNQHSVDYRTSPSGLPSEIHPIIFLQTLKGFISLQIFISFSRKPVYSTTDA